MRAWTILLGIAIVMPGGRAACGHAGLVRDWGLSRAWLVEQDCTHPERPAVLVEVPWTTLETKEQPDRRAEVGRKAAAPAVWAGKRVLVIGHEANAETQLTGTALNTARMGERVAVRAGWDGVILHGRVVEPGVVELEPERGRQ